MSNMRLTLELTAIDRMSKVVQGAARNAIRSAGSVHKNAQRNASLARGRALDAGMAVAGGAAMLAFPLKMAANYERLRIQMQALTGDAQKGNEIFERTVRLASETPLEVTQIATGVSRLMGFGRAANDAMEDIKMLGDVTMVTGGDLQLAMIAYGQAAGEGRIMTRDLTQLVNAGVPIFQMLEKVVDTSGTSIKEMASEGKLSFEILQEAFRVATKEGGQFEEGMKTMSKTAFGQLTIITDQVGQLAAVFGDALLPELKALADWLKPTIASFREWAKENSWLVKTVMYAIAAFTAFAAISLIVNGVIWLVYSAIAAYGLSLTRLSFITFVVRYRTWQLGLATKGLRKNLILAGKAALKFSWQLIKFAARGIVSAVSGIGTLIGSIFSLNTAIFSIPIIGWILAIVAAIGAISYAVYTNWTAIKGFFGNLWAEFEELSSKFTVFGYSLGDAIVAGLTSVFPTIAGIINIIREEFRILDYVFAFFDGDSSSAEVIGRSVVDMNSATALSESPFGGSSIEIPRNQQLASSTSVNYNPQITISGGEAAEQAENFAAQLAEHKIEMMDLIKEVNESEDRKRYGA